MQIDLSSRPLGGCSGFLCGLYSTCAFINLSHAWARRRLASVEPTLALHSAPQATGTFQECGRTTAERHHIRTGVRWYSLPVAIGELGRNRPVDLWPCGGSGQLSPKRFLTAYETMQGQLERSGDKSGVHDIMEKSCLCSVGCMLSAVCCDSTIFDFCCCLWAACVCCSLCFECCLMYVVFMDGILPFLRMFPTLSGTLLALGYLLFLYGS